MPERNGNPITALELERDDSEHVDPKAFAWLPDIQQAQLKVAAGKALGIAARSSSATPMRRPASS